MQRMSHTLHLSVKEHSISNRRSATGVDAHNNRKYQEQSNENINFENTKFNTTLIGSDNITKDISNVYHELFDEALASYNKKQTRKDRIIPDYMEHIANSKQQSIAEEFIIQFGKYNSQDSLHLDFETKEDVENIKNAYSDYLEELQRQIPNFKIANATLHMDEKNPHLHVVGVPYAEGYKKGLTKQVAKSRTFDNKLSTLQDVMSQKMVDVMKEHLDLDVYHEKQAGRNKNYRAEEVAEQNKIIKEQEDQIARLNISIDQLKKEEQEYTDFRNEVESNMKGLIEKNNAILKAEERLELEEQEITAKFSKIELQEKEFEELQADFNNRYDTLLTNLDSINKYEEIILEQSSEIKQDIDNLVKDFNDHDFKPESDNYTTQLRVIMNMLNQENNTQVSPGVGLLGIETSAIAYKIIETKDLSIDNDTHKELETYYRRYTEKNNLRPKVQKVEKKVENLKTTQRKMNKHTDKIKNRFKRKNTDLEL